MGHGQDSLQRDYVGVAWDPCEMASKLYIQNYKL